MWRRRRQLPGTAAVVENAEARSDVRIQIDRQHAEGRLLTDFDPRLVGRAARLLHDDGRVENILVVRPDGWFLIAGVPRPYDPAS